MSPTQPPATQQAGDNRAGGYQRSPSGLLGAMVVTVLAVLAFVGFRSVTADNDPTPTRAVDYTSSLRAGRDARQLQTLVPPSLPRGWKATSASYHPGPSPSWHLGLLTDTQQYVGIEESTESIEDLAREHVDADAERGADVTIDGRPWQVWTDRGGDYAVARSLVRDGRTVESWLVVGTAAEATVRDVAGSLRGGPVRTG
jgi:hypothetical protein